MGRQLLGEEVQCRQRPVILNVRERDTSQWRIVGGARKTVGVGEQTTTHTIAGFRVDWYGLQEE